MPSSRGASDAEVAKDGAILDPVELLARGLGNARAGAIGTAIEYLTRAGEAGPHELDHVQRATLLATTLECRLARGELADARAVGVQLGPYLERPGPAGATAHYGRGELCAAANDVELASGHFARIPRLLDAGSDNPSRAPRSPASTSSSRGLPARRTRSPSGCAPSPPSTPTPTAPPCSAGPWTSSTGC